MPNSITVHTSKSPIDPLADGVKLDVLVATHFMGEEVYEERWGKQKQYGAFSLGKPDYYDSAGEMILFNPLPSYSYDMADAWKVVEKLHEVSGVCGFTLMFDDDQWICKLGWSNEGEACNGMGVADTAPLAICRAALDAVK